MRRSSPPPLEERLRNVSHHLCITSKLSCLARQLGDGATVAKPEAAALDCISTICERDKPFHILTISNLPRRWGQNRVFQAQNVMFF